MPLKRDLGPVANFRTKVGGESGEPAQHVYSPESSGRSGQPTRESKRTENRDSA